MANNLVDNTNYGFTEGVPEETANQEPLKKCEILPGDLNDLTTPGFYSMLYGNNTPTAPSGGISAGWFIIVAPSNYDEVFQIAITLGSSSNIGVLIYGRMKMRNGNWTSWKGIYQN